MADSGLCDAEFDGSAGEAQVAGGDQPLSIATRDSLIAELPQIASDF